MRADIYEMRTELKKIEYELSLNNSLSTYRDLLVMGTKALEWANNRWDPFDLALTGIGDHMCSQQKRFDRVFQRIHERYKTKMEVHPLVELLLTYGGMVCMFHITKKMAAALPVEGVASMMQGRPDILQNMMSAMASQGKQAQGAPQQAPPPPPQQTQTQTQAQAQAQAPGPGGARREMQMPNFGNMFMPPVNMMPVPPPVRFGDPPAPPASHMGAADAAGLRAMTEERSMLRPLSPVQEQEDRFSDVISEDLQSVPGDLASVLSDGSSAIKTLRVGGGKGKGKGSKAKNKVVFKL